MILLYATVCGRLLNLKREVQVFVMAGVVEYVCCPVRVHVLPRMPHPETLRLYETLNAVSPDFSEEEPPLVSAECAVLLGPSQTWRQYPVLHMDSSPALSSNRVSSCRVSL